jgi:ureidoglycolate hydrolase
LRTIELVTEPLSAASFAPFGVLPPDEGDGRPTADLEFLQHDGWVNYIEHTLDEITASTDGYRCELLNRHDTHTQTLMPVSGPAVIVVAPSGVDFTNAGDFDTVHAFALPVLSCVHLHRGTWHWGPYPLGAAEVRIFNIQGRGYPNDNGVVHFVRDHGLAYDVKSTLD